MKRSTRVNWKEIYKPTNIEEREADVQYRLMHNIHVLPSMPVLHHINHITPEARNAAGVVKGKHVCSSTAHQSGLLYFFSTDYSRGSSQMWIMNFEHYWCLVPHARVRGKEHVRLSNYPIISLKATILGVFKPLPTNCLETPHPKWYHPRISLPQLPLHSPPLPS